MHIFPVLLDTSEHQPSPDGDFKREDGQEDEDRHFIPQQLQHDPNESHSHGEKAPEGDRARDIL
jgi:hypothetical protein